MHAFIFFKKITWRSHIFSILYACHLLTYGQNADREVLLLQITTEVWSLETLEDFLLSMLVAKHLLSVKRDTRLRLSGGLGLDNFHFFLHIFSSSPLKPLKPSKEKYGKRGGYPPTKLLKQTGAEFE